MTKSVYSVGVCVEGEDVVLGKDHTFKAKARTKD